MNKIYVFSVVIIATFCSCLAQNEYDIQGVTKLNGEECGCQKNPDPQPQNFKQNFQSNAGFSDPQAIRYVRATQNKPKSTPPKSSKPEPKPSVKTEQIYYLFPLQIFYVEQYIKNKIPPRYSSAPLHPVSHFKSAPSKGGTKH